ncbi:hypothetical protein IAT40_003346 [Kwoniella sp. CBS 6097]
MARGPTGNAYPSITASRPARSTSTPSSHQLGASPTSVSVVSVVVDQGNEAGPSNGQDTSGIKWYKQYNKKRPGHIELSTGGHPYVCRSITFGSPYDAKKRRYQGVQFWPFVGPLEPSGLPDGLASWDEYRGMLGLVTDGELVLARCTGEDPFQIQSAILIDDDLYTLAWTYDPITLCPLIVTGGEKGLVYVVDVLSRKLVRVLRGHGGPIFCVAVKMLYPHIIASSSDDKTIRIWNIKGADEPLLPLGRMPDQDYPMGDADEGNCVIAIIAGEGKGGHRFYVASVAFHPTKDAMASCGLDRAVKVWPLPPLPEPEQSPTPTRLGYRPKIVHLPLFSTTRLFDDFTDYIEWLNEDTLITRGRRQLAIWQWIGYKRYFVPGRAAPMSHEPISSDFLDSGSFMVLGRQLLGPDSWAITPGFHRGFKPSTPSEQSKIALNPDLVTDPLIAVAYYPDGKEPSIPEISIFNPILADESAGQRPRLPHVLRPLPSSPETNTDTDSSNSNSPHKSDVTDNVHPAKGRTGVININKARDQDQRVNQGKGNQSVLTRVEANIVSVQSLGASMEEPIVIDHSDDEIDMLTLRSEVRTNPNDERSVIDDGSDESGFGEDSLWCPNPTFEPWRLVATAWPGISRNYAKSRMSPRNLKPSGNICNIAISPRGAEFVVGVGEHETIFVWNLARSQDDAKEA